MDERLRAAPGKIQTGYKEAFQTLEQASSRGAGIPHLPTPLTCFNLTITSKSFATEMFCYSSDGFYGPQS